MNKAFIWIVTILAARKSLSQESEFLKTSFSCHGRVPGYYADIETGCRTYHLCDGSKKYTYECPLRTLFQQRSRICDHFYLVTCGKPVNRLEELPYQKELSKNTPHKDQEKTITIDWGASSTSDKEAAGNSGHFMALWPSTSTTQPKKSAVSSEVQASDSTTMVDRRELATTASSLPDPSSSDRSKPSTGIKLKLKDFRLLFYIPEFDNSSAVKTAKELIIPVNDGVSFNFLNRTVEQRTHSACPRHCNPRFRIFGTCHPCIMIK